MTRFITPTLGLLAAFALTTSPARAARPNIIVILADDMGFSDLGCYGSEIATPNLDSLAAGGVRFTQFHNTARCCPTRASLMTGLAPHQAGIGHMTRELDSAAAAEAIPAAYQGHINDRCVTLAQMAGSAGYATLMAGKWHLAGKDQADWPLQRGFEKYYGCISGATRYFKPTGVRIMYSGNTPDPNPASTTDRPFYTTDAFADHAIGFIGEELRGQKRPFFLYLAFTAPHWPLQAHPEEIVKYRGKYDIGWDRLREQRYRRQIELGLIDPKWKPSPRDPRVPAWDTLDEKRKEDLAMRMTVYAAMIDRLDQNVGKLVAFLKREGQLDNTLIMFLSDNGACAEGGIFGRGNVLDEKERNESNDLAVGTGWANASSTPFRLYKHFAHEGGTGTPFFMHWPAGISPRKDWYREPAQLPDIMPTVVALTGATYPTSWRGHAVLPIEGVSLVPAFKGKSLKRRLPLFMEHEDNAYIREGDWKLVGRGVSPASGLKTAKWELYNLKLDGTELNDLAAAKPGKVAEMSKRWAEWADRVGVYPKTARGAQSAEGPAAQGR